MRGLVILLVVLAMAVAGPSLAAPQPSPTAWVYGEGATPCNQFMEKTGGDAGWPAGAITTQFVFWCQGYLSGLNVAVATLRGEVERNGYPGTNEPQSVVRSLINYCRAHPSDLFYQACNNLGMELRSKVGK